MYQTVNLMFNYFLKLLVILKVILFLETAAERRGMSNQAAEGRSTSTMTKVPVMEIVRPHDSLQGTPSADS